MSQIPERASDPNEGLVSGLPASAVQALYHAATGKTENLTKQLSKEFIIRRYDIEQLYIKIMQQLEHYEKVAGPTVTVKVRFGNHESQQFSSWERFKLFDSGRTEIVSDLVLKFEFVIKLPEIKSAQRYVLNIDIDSKLPVYIEQGRARLSFLSFILFLEDMPSLTVSVDFIDYLCAKNFVQIVEDWFATLDSSPSTQWRRWCKRVSMPWPIMFRTVFSNIGAAAFLAIYTYLKGPDLGGTTQLMYLLCVTIVAWTLFGMIFQQRLMPLLPVRSISCMRGAARRELRLTPYLVAPELKG